MTMIGWAQIALFCALVIAVTRPVGGLLASIATGTRNFLTPIFGPVERGLYAVAGVRPEVEQSWRGYAVAMLVFKIVCFLAAYGILRLQTFLPFNPAGQGEITPDLAYNTAISFLTNTNWQSYGGESTMSHGSQMLALTVQNFTSAAAGIAIAMAFVRGFSRRQMKTIGNFWVDLVRVTLYGLLPLCIIYALVLVWQGVPQTMSGPIDVMTLEGIKQTIAVGPVATQEAIKMLGTNGGAVLHRDHRCFLRRGQFDDRELPTAGWDDPDAQHHAGRDHLRRCRLRAVWLPDVRDHCCVRRGPDGGPHAGISWQEDRSA